MIHASNIYILVIWYIMWHLSPIPKQIEDNVFVKFVVGLQNVRRFVEELGPMEELGHENVWWIT